MKIAISLICFSWPLLFSVSLDAAISATHAWTLDALIPTEPAPANDDEEIQFLHQLSSDGNFYGPDRQYSRSESISFTRSSPDTGYSAATFNFQYNIQDISEGDRIELRQNISRSSVGIGEGYAFDGRGSITTHSVITYDESIQLQFRTEASTVPGGFGPLSLKNLAIRDLTTGSEIYPAFEFEGFHDFLGQYAELEDGRTIQFTHLAGFWAVDINLPEGSTAIHQLEIITDMEYAFAASGNGFYSSTGHTHLVVVPEAAQAPLLLAVAMAAGVTTLRRRLISHPTSPRRRAA